MIYQSCKLVQIHVRVFEKEHFMQKIVNMGANELNFSEFQVLFLMMGQKTLRCTATN